MGAGLTQHVAATWIVVFLWAPPVVAARSNEGAAIPRESTASGRTPRRLVQPPPLVKLPPAIAPPRIPQTPQAPRIPGPPGTLPPAGPNKASPPAPKPSATPRTSSPTPASAKLLKRTPEAALSKPLFPAALAGDSDGSPGAGASGSGRWILSTITALAVVIGLIFLLRAVLVRLGSAAAPSSRSPLLEVLGSVRVAPRQRVLILRVGRRLVVVAESAAGMTALADIDDPEEVAELLQAAPTATRPGSADGFKGLLQRFGSQYGRNRSTVEDPLGAEESEFQVDRARDEVSGLLSRVRLVGKGGRA